MNDKRDLTVTIEVRNNGIVSIGIYDRDSREYLILEKQGYQNCSPFGVPGITVNVTEATALPELSNTVLNRRLATFSIDEHYLGELT